MPYRGISFSSGEQAFVISWHSVCYKSDYDPVTVMQGRHLISNRDYVGDITVDTGF